MPSVISAAIGKEVRYVDVPESAATEAMTGMGVPPVLIDWPMGLNHVIKKGWAAVVSPDGQLLTGHEPRRIEDFVRENLGAWKQGNSVAPGLRSWPRGLNLEAATASRHSRLKANCAVSCFAIAALRPPQARGEALTGEWVNIGLQ